MAPPNSSWTEWQGEVLAVLGKEWASERRGRSGLATGALFSLVTCVAVSLVFYNKNVNDPFNGLAAVTAGSLWVALLFGALLTGPRTFLQEDEGGTVDLLRLTCRPHAVFWGKWLFVAGQSLALALLTSGLFLILIGQEVPHPGLFLLSLAGGTLALAGTVTCTGAIATGATGRATLAATLAVPLLLGLLQQAITATRASFGGGEAGTGLLAAVGLVAYATLAALVGPWIYAATWKN